MHFLLHALLHAVGSVVVVPYVALAAMFLFIGEVARAKGMPAVFRVLWDNLDRFVGWWFYATPVLWLCLIATGFVPHVQRASSLCLCLLAVASFLVIVTLSSTRVGVGELVFLLPCLVVAATSAWLSFRAGPSVVDAA